MASQTVDPVLLTPYGLGYQQHCLGGGYMFIVHMVDQLKLGTAISATASIATLCLFHLGDIVADDAAP